MDPVKLAPGRVAKLSTNYIYMPEFQPDVVKKSASAAHKLSIFIINICKAARVDEMIKVTSHPPVTRNQHPHTPERERESLCACVTH